MNRSPILKALSSIRKSGARTLLMGGQACVFYGAAEFSRDLDLMVLADAGNLTHLRAALDDLQASVIAVPNFEESLLRRGHAVHFRCRQAGVEGLRIDLMAALRGVDGFEPLWARRTTLAVAGEQVDLMGIEDLVRAKKTQRDKDWPMIRRLMEHSYFEHSRNATPELVGFWLRELRTAGLLAEVAAAYPEAARALAPPRPAVAAALCGGPAAIQDSLDAEERDERRRDREYWQPLKLELEELRRSRPRGGQG